MSSFPRSHLSLVDGSVTYSTSYGVVGHGFDQAAAWTAAPAYDEYPAYGTYPPAEELPATGWADADAGEEPWRLDALCAETDPEAFFPEKGGSTREAKRVCGGCSVRAECLEFALANDERFGIWGGLSERERRRLRLARRDSLTA